MSRIEDTRTRIEGAIANLKYATSPKDIAWSIRRAITKLGNAAGHMNSEQEELRQIMEQAHTDMAKKNFNSIEDWKHSYQAWSANAKSKLEEFLSKFDLLNSEGKFASAGASGGARGGPKAFKISFGPDDEITSSQFLTEFFSSGNFNEIAQGNLAFDEGVSLTFAALGHPEVNAEHTVYPQISRAIVRSLRGKFKAPKAESQGAGEQTDRKSKRKQPAK